MPPDDRACKWPAALAVLALIGIGLHGPARAETDVFQQAVNYVFTGQVDVKDGPEITDREACIVVMRDPRFNRYIRYYLRRFKMDDALFEKKFGGSNVSYELDVKGDDVVIEYLDPNTKAGHSRLPVRANSLAGRHRPDPESLRDYLLQILQDREAEEPVLDAVFLVPSSPANPPITQPALSAGCSRRMKAHANHAAAVRGGIPCRRHERAGGRRQLRLAAGADRGRRAVGFGQRLQHRRALSRQRRQRLGLSRPDGPRSRRCRSCRR